MKTKRFYGENTKYKSELGGEGLSLNYERLLEHATQRESK